jgi:hypothetical protein
VTADDDQQQAQQDQPPRAPPPERKQASAEEKWKIAHEVKKEMQEVERIRAVVKKQGRRLAVSRPNSPERRFLGRILAASTLRNKKQVKDRSKAAAAKKALKDSSAVAMEQVQVSIHGLVW